MAFKRLWNTICGRSEPAQSTESNETKAKPHRKAKAPAQQSNSAKATTMPSPRVFSMRGPTAHRALLKQLQGSSIRSVLEIGVGDGSKTPVVLNHLAQSVAEHPTPIRYAVIDQFELGGSELTLREFHVRLSGLSMRPAIFPEPVAQGLVSVAHRIGAVDLILVDEAIDLESISNLGGPLAKVTHATTRMLRCSDGRWQDIRHNRRQRAA